jgi:hypothetical protein
MAMAMSEVLAEKDGEELVSASTFAVEAITEESHRKASLRDPR